MKPNLPVNLTMYGDIKKQCRRLNTFYMRILKKEEIDHDDEDDDDNDISV